MNRTQIIQLETRHVRQALDYLAGKPLEGAFLQSLIARLGTCRGGREVRFVAWGGDGGRALGGVMLVSALVVPIADDPEIAAAFGRELGRSQIRMRNIVGRRETVQTVWEAMGDDGGRRPVPRLVRDRQPVYRLRRGELRPAAGGAGLRPATLADLETVVAAGAAMMVEEVDEDPLRERAQEFRRFIRERIRRGDEFVWIDEQGLCFRCNLSARTWQIAQIEGVFTPRARRRQGLAARGMSSLCARLLPEVPELCLYVNDFNLPAIRLYERLGFRYVFDFKSIFLP